MVICKYYLQGNCRFGAKCANEHFDVKTIIKTEIESAVKGHQWILSCFGPFKEKPCIPNFIEDQSFEEIRLLCYEAKLRNNFPAVQQEISNKVVDATNKLKQLLGLSRDVIEIVCNLYDTSSTDVTSQKNPFGLNDVNQGSLFGATAQPSPFSNSGFGQTSLFGNKDSVGSTVAVTGGNLFGQTTFGGAPSFGGAPKPTGFGTFSLPQINSSQAQQNIVPQQTPFGGSGQSIFAQQSAIQQSSAGGNLFGQTGAVALTPQQQIQQSSFGSFLQPQIASSEQTMGFENFQQQLAPALPAGGNLFGNGVNTVQQQNFFQQPQNTFGSPPASVFGQQSAGQAHMSYEMTAPQPATSIFAQQSQSQQPQQVPTNTFGVATNVLSLNPNSENPILNSYYRKIDEITAEELEAFKADKFEISSLPINPPPRELCI